MEDEDFLRFAVFAKENMKKKNTILPPAFMKEVKGIFFGGCVARGAGSSFRAQAHAHNSTSDKYFGWICVRGFNQKTLRRKLGVIVQNDDGQMEVVKPSHTLMHEYAHILTPDHWHDDVWRKKMRELGQPIRQRYRKRPKTKSGYAKEGFSENGDAL